MELTSYTSKVADTVKFCINQKFELYHQNTDSFMIDALYMHLIYENQDFRIEGLSDFVGKMKSFSNSRIKAHQFTQSPITESISSLLIASVLYLESGDETVMKSDVHKLIKERLNPSIRNGIIKDTSHTLILIYSLAKMGIWTSNQVEGQLRSLLFSYSMNTPRLRSLDIMFVVKLTQVYPDNQILDSLARKLIENQQITGNEEDTLILKYTDLWYKYTKNKVSIPLIADAFKFVASIPLEEFQFGDYYEGYKRPSKWLGSIYPCFLLNYVTIINQIYEKIMSEQNTKAAVEEFNELVSENGKNIQIAKRGNSHKTPCIALKTSTGFRFQLETNVEVGDILFYNAANYHVDQVKEYYFNQIFVGREVICSQVELAHPATSYDFSGAQFHGTNSIIQFGSSSVASQSNTVNTLNDVQPYIELLKLFRQIPSNDLPEEVATQLDIVEVEIQKPKPILEKIKGPLITVGKWILANPDKALKIGEKLKELAVQYGQPIIDILPRLG